MNSAIAIPIIAVSAFFLLSIDFTKCQDDSLSTIKVEGDRYVLQGSNCNAQQFPQPCQRCQNAIDCAIECSVYSKTRKGNCAGFTYFKGNKMAANQTVCKLASSLNCPNSRTLNSPPAEMFFRAPSQAPTSTLYYRRVEGASKPSNQGPITGDVLLTKRREGIDALDQNFCGSGGNTNLYDPSLPKLKIVGGLSAEVGEFPFQVMLTMNFFDPIDNLQKVSLCGASLIDREWIITAAHCFPPAILQSPRKTINASVGRLHYQFEQDASYETFVIARDRDNSNIFIHPSYRDEKFNYDYALARLKPGLKKFTKLISPVCLPQSPVPGYGDKIVVTTGWGATSSSQRRGAIQAMKDYGVNPSYRGMPGFPDILQKLSRRLLPTEECGAELRSTNLFDPRTMMCSSKSGMRDQCQGDSGGPWATVDRPFGASGGSRWVLIGVTSWGDVCGSGVGVGAKINDDILKWIKRTVANANGRPTYGNTYEADINQMGYPAALADGSNLDYSSDYYGSNSEPEPEFNENPDPNQQTLRYRGALGSYMGDSVGNIPPWYAGARPRPKGPFPSYWHYART